ncbi:VOC family protein [Futiania mangrovi]|uniref:VOC family protein n=1 Tax=Futiania mangrovi TaxID=2959716 RepID=A0A9J6P7V7_9PROT|nr:VOC family protein [Futiania mangrovii]MCP1335292.1 VOC family protein [Futiania mangrovii]
MGQLPEGDGIFLDHVAFFVADMGAAETLLQAMGFVLTPFTHQRNQGPDGPVPAGTANRCIMLRAGYVEILTAVTPTPLSDRLKAAVARYPGLHLIAYVAGNLDAAVARLAEGGFEPDPPVALRRPVDLPGGGTAEAAFSVVRVPPEKMPEGRIQVLAHHTPDIVWQERWTDQPNAILGLEGTLLVMPDPAEAVARFAAFAGGTRSMPRPAVNVLTHDRGWLAFTETARVGEVLPAAPCDCPAPWIAALTLRSADLARTRAHFEEAGLAPAEDDGGRMLYRLPEALGGFLEILGPGSRSRFTG